MDFLSCFTCSCVLFLNTFILLLDFKQENLSRCELWWSDLPSSSAGFKLLAQELASKWKRGIFLHMHTFWFCFVSFNLVLLDCFWPCSKLRAGKMCVFSDIHVFLFPNSVSLSVEVLQPVDKIIFHFFFSFRKGVCLVPGSWSALMWLSVLFLACSWG